MWRVRRRLFKQLSIQEIGFFDCVRTGELMNRLSEVRIVKSDAMLLHWSVFYWLDKRMNTICMPGTLFCSAKIYNMGVFDIYTRHSKVITFTFIEMAVSDLGHSSAQLKSISVVATILFPCLRLSFCSHICKCSKLTASCSIIYHMPTLAIELEASLQALAAAMSMFICKVLTYIRKYFAD